MVKGYLNMEEDIWLRNMVIALPKIAWGRAAKKQAAVPAELEFALKNLTVERGSEPGACFMLEHKSLSPELLAYLWLAMDARMNIVISGAQGSGKTTLMYALAQLIAPHEKVVTIEDNANALRLNGPVFNTVAPYGPRSGKSAPKNQVVNALRMRPDRIIMGEIRGEEAARLFSGANLGTPFMTTVESADEGLAVIRKLLAKPMALEQRDLRMLDLSVHMGRAEPGRHTVLSVIEYKWLSRAETDSGLIIRNSDMVSTAKVAENAELSKAFAAVSKVMEGHARAEGVTRAEAERELELRAGILSRACAMSKDEGEFSENTRRLRYA